MVNGCIHLQYRGNPYVLLSEKGALHYDVGQEVEDTGVTYINGALHINVERLGEETFSMSEDETRDHVLGVIMAETFSLKAGLKKFGEKGEKAVMKELNSFPAKWFLVDWLYVSRVTYVLWAKTLNGGINTNTNQKIDFDR